MAREQGKATNGSPEGKLEGNDYALLRRAVLSALAGAPVILTLSSSFAQAESMLGASMDPCSVPRNPTAPPSNPEECEPPPGPPSGT